MARYDKKPHFYDTPAGIEARQVLTAMLADEAFKTEAGYAANIILHPDNQISFVDKHMDYLRLHPATDPKHYLSNLRLMTRIK